MQPMSSSFQANGGLEMGAEIAAAEALDPLSGSPSEQCDLILESQGRNLVVVVHGSLTVAYARLLLIRLRDLGASSA